MQKKFIKQMILLNKTVYDNTFSMVSSLQGHAEKMFNMYLERATGFPEEGKKAISEWVDIYNKGSRDFQMAVQDSFKKIDNIFEVPGK